MYQSFNLNFYCRESKATKNGTAPVELSVNVNGERHFLNLPFKAYPKDFNKKRKPKEIQDYIDLMRVRVNEILTEMLRNGEPVTTKALIDYLKNGGYKSYTVQTLVDDFLGIQKKRIGKELSKGVYRKYELVGELLLKYVPGTSECTAITPAIMKTIYADTYEKYDESTAAGYMTKMKAFTTFAIDNDRLKVNPFQTLKIVKGSKPIEYLAEEDIEVLKNAKIENQSLERIRDCALFQICSGISYADTLALVPEDLKEADGTYYIHKERIKTGTEYTAVLLPTAVEIWNKYNGNLPFISNQKYNLYLKTLGDLCGLKTSLHSHLFRHTYCTLLLNKGISIKTISKCAGHTNSKITEAYYAHLQTKTIIDEVSKIM